MALCCAGWLPEAALAQGTYYVDPLGDNEGAGSAASPLATIAEAIRRAIAGDTIVVNDGVYHESLTTRNDGSAGAPIVLRAANPGQAEVLADARYALDVVNPHWRVEGLVFDGNFNNFDVLRVRTTADYLTLQNIEVRNGSRDGADLGSNEIVITPETDFLQNVTIENSRFHHLLWNDGGTRMDAHGIVAGGVRDMSIRDTEVNYVSGDALQLADGAWDRVLVEGVTFWNGALPSAAGGFAAGINPGENAIDTKQDAVIDTRGTLTIRDSTFYGWDGDLVGNTSALNLKEKIAATVEGNTLHGNQFGLQVRGLTGDNGAHVAAGSNVFHGNAVAVRYEDGANQLHVWNNTFGQGNAQSFQPVPSGSGAGSDFQVENNLFLAASKPTQAGSSSNLAVDATSFVNVAGNNYRLNLSSPALDAAAASALVPVDRDLVPRPQHGAPDVGAYELSAMAAIVSPDTMDARHVGPAGHAVEFVGTAAGLLTPVGVDYDAAGNLYVADALRSEIDRFDRAGNKTVIAGLAQGVVSPTGLDHTADGHLLVANYLGGNVLSIDSLGQATVLAGAAQGLNRPFDVARTATGETLIADLDGRKVIVLSPGGQASVLADASDGLLTPISVTSDALGNVYVADTLLSRVYRFDAGGTGIVWADVADGVVTPTGLAWDTDGNLLVSNYLSNSLVRIDTSGNATLLGDAADGVQRPFDVAFFDPFAGLGARRFAAVPEPASWVLAGVACVVLGVWRCCARKTSTTLLLMVAVLCQSSATMADDERPSRRAGKPIKLAPRPTTWDRTMTDRFLPDVRAVIGDVPTWDDAVADAAQTARPTDSATSGSQAATQQAGPRWSEIVSVETLEDEVEAAAQALSAATKSGAAFKSGGFREARRQCSWLAVLFQVIGDFDADVRWRNVAATMGERLSRAAANCKAASDATHKEAKQLAGDLQDLIRGNPPAIEVGEAQRAWPEIADRPPLMARLEAGQHGRLDAWTADQATFERQAEALAREAEVQRLLVRVLLDEGYEYAHEDSYREAAEALANAAGDVLQAVRGGDFERAQAAVRQAEQSCTACHTDFRS